MSERTDLGTHGNLAEVYDLVQKPAQADRSEAIHRAIDQCLITMVYQPIVDLQTGSIFAYEALCRSRLPQFDSPPALIEAATEVGRIGELGRLQRKLASKNCANYPIFVNISPHEFDDVYLVRPDDAIFRHRRPVYLEITESVPLVFFDQCHSVLGELRRKGARLAIDDLGAGYSNLKYIADLAPDIVKLDRELVAGCTREGAQYKLLCSIAQLCREVDAKVVAEGVENAEELDAVTSAGIELCQGFFLGRPKSSPPEVCWPAADILSTARTAERIAARRRERGGLSREEEQRRIEEMEELSSALEKSVRKARGEVVRLRKALNKAEVKTERTQTRLARVEDSLVESESERQRLAEMWEIQSTPDELEIVVPVRTRTRSSGRFRKVALHALIWATGLVAGVALYRFDPGVADLALRHGSPGLAESGGVSAPEVEQMEDSAPSIAEPVVGVAAAPTAETEAVAEVTVQPALPAVVVTPEPSPEAVARERISDLLNAWAAAWSQQDVDGYVDSYVADFVSDSGLGGADWRAQRRDRLAHPEFIRVGIEDLSVELDGPRMARTTFLQSYESDTFDDRVRKELTLVFDDDQWRISREVSIP